MSGPAHDDDLAALQAALARMTPRPDGINIARLLFRAGQVSAPRRGWGWPYATAAATLLAALFGAILLIRPEPQPIERIVEVSVQALTPPTPRPEPSVANQPPDPEIIVDARQAERSGDYFQLRQEVLAKGVDALPPPAPWPAVVQPDELDVLLDIPRGAGKPGVLRPKHGSRSGDA